LKRNNFTEHFISSPRLFRGSIWY